MNDFGFQIKNENLLAQQCFLLFEKTLLSVGLFRCRHKQKNVYIYSVKLN